MCRWEINGISVAFPYEPYDIQKVYMAKIIECLETKSHGVLESPKGTGRTLSLLCATLAWLEKKTAIYSQQYSLVCMKHLLNKSSRTFKELEQQKLLEKPQVIYSSRTQRQCLKVIQELKITDYISNAIVKKVDTNYLYIELQNGAYITFIPYNYLLDPKIRKALGIQLTRNTVVIFDDAYNVECTCNELVSMRLQSVDILTCIEELKRLVEILYPAVEKKELLVLTGDRDRPDFTQNELCYVQESLQKFKQALDKVPIISVKECVLRDGAYIYHIMKEASINYGNANELIEKIDRIVQYMSAVNESPFQKGQNWLLLFTDLLRIIFAKNCRNFHERVKLCYRVHVQVGKAVNKMKSWNSENKILSFWCLSPAFGMALLMDEGVQSVILAGNALAPNPLIAQLKMKVNIRLENNPYILKNDQVYVRIIRTGCDGQCLKYSYKNRTNERYLQSLGMTIKNLTRVIPSGLLIFFPSYIAMKLCEKNWKDNGTWNYISEQKTIFVESHKKDLLQESMDQFTALANNPASNGAIFMAICGGEVSESLDFSDVNCRAVIIIGLPFHSQREPKVKLKKKYMDICKISRSEFLDGDEWYNLEATKLVNQVISRVIRHRNDYGAIIFMDQRFQERYIQRHLSMWLNSRIKLSDKFSDTLKELKVFFKTASIEYNSNNVTADLSVSPPSNRRPNFGPLYRDTFKGKKMNGKLTSISGTDMILDELNPDFFKTIVMT